jgi:Tfp pilus assembly protein PilF
MDEARGEVAAPGRPLSPIPVPLAELFSVAAEREHEGRLADAERILGHILAAEPDQADALHLQGLVAFRQGRTAEALVLLRRSVARNPQAPLFWRNICEVLRVTGYLDEAVEAGRRAVELAPEDPVALANLGVIHGERLELADAERCQRRALQLDPGSARAHFGLAETLLIQGDMERGWEEYRWRFQLAGAGRNLPPDAGPAWDGRALASGRLLVIADQGYGDAIQFGRYLPQVLERCPAPVVACGRDLQGLMRQLGAQTLVERWQDVGAVDATVTLSGLPRIFGTRVGTIPAPIPYFQPDPALTRHWARRLDELAPRLARRVGLAWAGRPTHANDHRRSTTLRALAPLFELDGVSFVSLQKGPRQADLASYFGRAPIVSLGPEIATWEGTLAILAKLDAIVCVDTAVAHLAGALGRPVHMLLPYAGEWRWLLERTDSPWYPTLTLHRQPVRGDWASAAASAARALVKEPV